MIIAQISDTHIKRKGRLLHHMIDTARYLKRAVKRLNHLDPPPDVVLATGDLTESGKPKEYRRLRKILADLAVRDPAGFQQFAQQAKAHLAA